MLYLKVSSKTLGSKKKTCLVNAKIIFKGIIKDNNGLKDSNKKFNLKLVLEVFKYKIDYYSIEVYGENELTLSKLQQMVSRK